MIWSDIVGLIGAFILSIRFFPIIYEQYKNPLKEINYLFCLLELAACIFLGISAFSINSIPFIVCNILSFTNVVILLLINLYGKFKSSTTPVVSE